MKVAYDKISDRWEVALAPSHHGFQQASFVNSIATTKVRGCQSCTLASLVKTVKGGLTLKFVLYLRFGEIWVVVSYVTTNVKYLYEGGRDI